MCSSERHSKHHGKRIGNCIVQAEAQKPKIHISVGVGWFPGVPSSQKFVNPAPGGPLAGGNVTAPKNKKSGDVQRIVATGMFSPV